MYEIYSKLTLKELGNSTVMGFFAAAELMLLTYYCLLREDEVKSVSNVSIDRPYLSTASTPIIRRLTPECQFLSKYHRMSTK